MRRALSWLADLKAAYRYRTACRLQKAGRLEEAERALLDLRQGFTGQELDRSALSTRLMVLVTLADVATALEHRALAREVLREWLAAWAGLRDEQPASPGIEVLAKWEVWARESLRRLEA